MLMFLVLGLIFLIAIPHLTVKASVIELSPDPDIQSAAGGIMNFSIAFLDGTNATANYQVVTEEQGNLIIQSINAILEGEEVEDLLEPLEEEEPKEEREVREEESSSDSSDDSAEFIPQPGDEQTFPEDMQPQQPQPS